jgi:hypothetical protein
MREPFSSPGGLTRTVRSNSAIPPVFRSSHGLLGSPTRGKLAWNAFILGIPLSFWRGKKMNTDLRKSIQTLHPQWGRSAGEAHTEKVGHRELPC